MATMVIFRTNYGTKQTIGTGFIFDESGQILEKFKTLEREWYGNKIGASCIPLGFYEVEKRYSIKFGHHFILKNTEPRSYILIHAGNFNFQTNGCILIGRKHTFLNNDLEIDVINSRPQLNLLLDIMPSKFTLKITDMYGTSKL